MEKVDLVWMATPRKEPPLHDILERNYLGHKQEVFDYTGGHLNESKLWRHPEKKARTSWEGSKKPAISLKQRSQLPPTKEELALLSQRDAMEDAMVNFSLALDTRSPRKNKSEEDRKTPRKLVALKDNEETSPLEIESPRRMRSDISHITKQTHDGVYVEELAAAEIILPKQNYPETGQDLMAPESEQQSSIIKTQLLEPTRKRQFERLQQFEHDVVRIQDTMETHMLTGLRAVEGLEDKLRLTLLSMEKGGTGPSFHRLQVYSTIFDELLQNSTIFGDVLLQIKKEYDSYVTHLLDLPPPQHRLLSMQLEQLISRGTAQPDTLAWEMERLKELEELAKEELERGSRLQEEERTLQEKFDNMPEPEKNKKKPSLLRRLGTESEERTISDKLEEAKADIWERLDMISKKRAEIKAKLVPSAVCAQLEQSCRDTEIEIQKIQKQKEYLTQINQETENELKTLFEGWEMPFEDEERMWRMINRPNDDYDDDDRSSDEEDERKWNWYIS